jgi:hypothetical protein
VTVDEAEAIVTVEEAPGGAFVRLAAGAVTVTAWLEASEALTLADRLAMACERQIPSAA